MGVPVMARFGDGFNNVEEHRVNDKAVVVVPVEGRAVTIKTIPFVPLHVLGDGEIDRLRFPVQPGVAQGGFDHGAEEKPIAHGRFNDARGLEGGDEIGLDAGLKIFPELGRRAKKSVRKKGGINDRLPAFIEVEEVGRRGIGGGVNRLPGEVAKFGPQFSFRCAIGREFEPGGDTRQGAAERFEV